MEFNFKSSDIVKHSAAHALAAAVKRIFPLVKVGLGPVTKSGFYYDFELESPITDENLELIEKNINQVIQDDLPFTHMVLGKQEGINLLLQMGQIYKAEIIKPIDEDKISFYKLGEEFIDLCRGPHLKSTGEIGIIKLISTEETYWKNNSDRPKMYRVHGVVFQNISEYNDYLQSVKLQDEKNIIKLSKDMNYIFDFESRIFFTEIGSQVINSIKEFIIQKFSSNENSIISIPNSISYKEAFKLIDYSITYKNLSYKLLPRTITAMIDQKQKDHAITSPAILLKILMANGKEIIQTNDYFEKVIDVCSYISKQDINIVIRCKDLENSLVKSLSFLFQKRVISHNKILSNKINGVAEIEVNVTDSIGKEWTLCRAFIPNFNSNQRIRYYNKSNQFEHAVEVGFYFNIFAIYSYIIKEFKYDIPFNFKPIQVMCIPKSKNQIDFATSINNKLLSNSFKSSIDVTTRSLNYKIKKAEAMEIPFILIIGQKEEANDAASIRNKNSEVGLIGIDNLINFINENKETSR